MSVGASVVTVSMSPNASGAVEAVAGIAEVVADRLDGTFNLCSGEATTLATIVHELNLSTRVEVGMLVEPERAHPADVTSVRGSPEKITGTTGWKPQTRLEESLEDLLEDWRGRV